MPISAMLIFSVDSHAAATSRITETLVGAAAGLAAGLMFAPLRVQPARDAVGDLTRQMADLLGQMADGLADEPDPRRAAEWLERTRALRGEIERVDDALGQAEESVRLNPRRLRYPTRRPGCARASTRWSGPPQTCGCWPVRWPTARGSTATTARSRTRRPAPGWPRCIAELSAAVRAYGQLIEAVPPRSAGCRRSRRPSRSRRQLEDHLEEAQRQQDRLADLLATDPAERPEGWPLRGEILAHVDRLRGELEPRRPSPPGPPRRPPRMLRRRRRSRARPRA